MGSAVVAAGSVAGAEGRAPFERAPFERRAAELRAEAQVELMAVGLKTAELETAEPVAAAPEAAELVAAELAEALASLAAGPRPSRRPPHRPMSWLFEPLVGAGSRVAGQRDADARRSCWPVAGAACWGRGFAPRTACSEASAIPIPTRRAGRNAPARASLRRPRSNSRLSARARRATTGRAAGCRGHSGWPTRRR